MSEPLLRGLMQLFAIIAKLDGVRPEERNVVEAFLNQQLNKEAVNKYLQAFDEYAQRQSRSKVDLTADSETFGERASVRDSSKMMLICNQVNQELTQEQKIVVLIRLFELVVADEKITDQEYEFVQTVGEVFNIPQKEFEHIERFVRQSNYESIDIENILLISKQGNKNLKRAKQLIVPDFEGFLVILRIESVDYYLLRYKGDKEYTLNSLPINPDQIYSLPTGGTIRGNKIHSIYFSDVEGKFWEHTQQDHINFVAEDIEYRFPNGKIGLRDISIAETSGALIGLMGSSGAGKSTLLEVLNGNLKPKKGKVLINGVSVHQNRKTLEGVIGYIPQDDLLIEQLSVYDNLLYAAKLSFSNLSPLMLRMKVNKLLQELGLTEIAHLKVGNSLDKTISGGQRKRLNIGLELLRAPSVLFVDEPTSGLSSRDSENIMDLLKELSSQGKLIFVVIHQPSSDIFKMFDKLYILDKGGYPVYYGNPVDAVIYFKQIINQINSENAECPECGNVNPEQIFDIIETRVVNEFGRFTDQRKVSPHEWYQHFKEHHKKSPIPTVNTSLPSTDTAKASRLQQAFIFFLRDIRAKLANWQYLLLTFLTPPFLGFILAYVCRHYVGDYSFRLNDNVPVFLFMCIIVSLFMGLIVSAEEIYKERKILKRESFLNLSWNSFLASKVALLIVISALQTTLFLLVALPILEVESLWWYYWIILFASAVFANILGLNISSAFNSAVTIYIIIPIILIPQLILGGIVIRFDRINPGLSNESGIPFVAEFMASRWAYEALAVAHFKENEYNRHYFSFDQQMANAEYKKTYLIPSLESKLSIIQSASSAEEEKQKAWQLICNTLEEESERLNTDLLPTAMGDKLPAPDELVDVEQTLSQLRKHYIAQFNKANQQKDELIRQATESPEAHQAFIEAKEKYTNDALNNFLLNTQSAERIVEKEDRFVQKIYPVYQAPEPGYFKAHFFAPVKYAGNWMLPTFTANALMIGLMAVLLYIVLYFNIPSRLINSSLSRLGRFGKE
ncbi:ATP-binding cassette domain-containing protein [Cytophagales bacterium LB-30]|uniref:ATP-binding cassette domain-containing protein n=1 Tax=Shiella aurantiaca TaxID=3058365 RepID=A0ABT8F8Y1_9BACT|nr:ATP-binding cassette domain-containing protein [Shiella aurantiaca]MDN4166416.1 ATP-binding cassette domain-containing protein [Shiella aurantiaca]